jgi:hypothetical protein
MKENVISFVRDSIGSEDRNPFNLCDIKDKKKKRIQEVERVRRVLMCTRNTIQKLNTVRRLY